MVGVDGEGLLESPSGNLQIATHGMGNTRVVVQICVFRQLADATVEDLDGTLEIAESGKQGPETQIARWVSRFALEGSSVGRHRLREAPGGGELATTQQVHLGRSGL